jgi:uncharacterized membrane protein
MGGGFIVLRLVHVALGVFWAGGVMFMNFIVGPALAASGPEGMKVMGELNRRRYFDIMIVAGTLTILSGLDMMRRDSAGFSPGWFRTPAGMGYSTGMAAAVIAYVVALVAIRPTLKRMGAIGARMAQAGPDGQPALMAEMLQARGRLIAFGGVGAMFLLIAVLAMSVARYL